MRKRVRLGDVIEIRTRRGLAYAQYYHKRNEWGSLLRVLPGFHETRPTSMAEVVSRENMFVTFFPLQAAINRGIVAIVGNEEIPPDARAFPLFREAGATDRSGRVLGWYLWDGERAQYVGELTKEQRKLPILGVWNDTALIEAIEEEWTPERDQR